MFTLDELEAGARRVYAEMSPTPCYAWPTLARTFGRRIWLKHENHTPIGAFKARGAITYIDWLTRTHPRAAGVVTATRGNHGQAQARAAAAAGLAASIVVPEGNSSEKNAAMRAFGAELVVHGPDFDAARARAQEIAEETGAVLVGPFHPEIVRGVASYGLELFQARPELEVVYAPIGCGSGVCSLIAARDALGHRAEIVGVVSDRADAAKRSVEAGRIVVSESADTFADGMAVRGPVPEAFEIYRHGLARIVAVSDDAVAEAIRILFRDTHNVAEGAGAAPLAAALEDRAQTGDAEVAAILCGGNIDTDVFAEVLAGRTPRPR